MFRTLIDARDALRTPATLLDVRSRAAYEEGHASGALHADVDVHLAAKVIDPSRGGRHPLPDPSAFAATLSSWGIRPGTQVLAYDEATGATAARLWWMLRSLGHEAAAMVDGGLAALRDAGAELTREEPRPTLAPPYPQRGWTWPTVEAHEVERLAKDGIVLDVRAPFRFRGEREPIDPVAGHIPGAVNLFFEENLQGGRFLDPAALAARYRALLGATPPGRVAVHCGSGVTACATLLALEHAGLHGAALYVGSWGEWCRQGRPVATG